MKTTRTLTKLTDELKGKIYIYLDNDKICKNFLQDAENEGFKFGTISPTQNHTADIIAINHNKQLSYVGFIGHMAFKNPNAVAGDFYRVDYRTFINGENNFLL